METYKPLISVIIPNFNNESFIALTLDSLVNQKYDNWEAIVVDDNSTDRSIEKVKKYSGIDNRIKLYLRDREPKGPSTCRNIGVEKSSGEYLVFLDSDDLLADFCLEQRVNYIEKNRELDFAVFKLELFNHQPGDLSIVFDKSPQKSESYLGMFLQNSLPWACPNPIWKKASFIKLGGFNEALVIMEDPELHSRALIEGVKFKVVKNVKSDCFYRQGNFNEGKKDYFYELSIKGRAYYIQEMVMILKQKDIPLNEYNGYLKDLRKAYIKLIKVFFIARIAIYKDLFFFMLNWCRQEKIISAKDHILITSLAKSWLSNYALIRWFRIRGILLQLIH